MKIGDLVDDGFDRIGIITKEDPYRGMVWVEMMWEHDSHGFRPLRKHIFQYRTGWYDVRDVEVYHESR